MSEVKKWSVTYTKHVKQKRKVYQDGFLELHCSNGTDKVFLYDDDLKMLESRFLKKDEVVRCGETLTFGCYLVDVTNLSSENAGNSAASTGRSEKNVGSVNYPKVRYNIKQEMPETNIGQVKRPSFKSSFRKESLGNNLGYDIKKEILETSVQPMKRPSFRSSFKKEKENSDLGHQAPASHSSTIKDAEREWRALYTSQKTQKAKKYHDGTLRLVVGVFDRRQVILYDDSRKQLESRYLKKDEVVECGETMTLDGYLVEVGDLEEQSKPLSNLNIQGRTKQSVENIGRLNKSRENGSENSIVPEYCPSAAHNIKTESESSVSGNNVVPQNCPSIIENMNREWHALYTTQKTKKAKKYHDGILRLVVGVAQRRQVTLLNEDGTVISSKYLISSEDVRTGMVLELASHLIEVGEARISQEGLQNDFSSGVVVDSSSRNYNVGSIIPDSSNFGKKNSSDGAQNTSSRKDLVSSSVTSEKAKFSQSSIRDANQILSNLKRPTEKSTCLDEESFIQKTSFSPLHPKLSQRIVIDSNLEASIQILNAASNARAVGHNSKISHSEDSHEAPSSVSDCRWKLWPPISPLVKVSRGLISDNGAVYPGEHTKATIFTSAGPQESDVVMLDTPNEKPDMDTEVPHDGFDDGLLIKECHFNIGSQASDEGNCQMTSAVSNEKSNQLCAGRMEKLTTYRRRDEPTFPSLNGSSSCSNDAGRANTNILKSKAKEQSQANGFPSFDLGF